MNDLSGKCVNVVLAVEMGRGMHFLEYPVKITANFNGRPLESDLVESDESPLFNTELVWETEKKELRKVRSTNAPLRVEVQYIDKNQRKDRLGFALLSPRCASIIPVNSKLEIPFKWQKLLGVAAEHKAHHPELYLSLTIRDIAGAIVSQPEQPYLAGISVEGTETDAETEVPFEKDGEAIPIQYLSDGFVQIGNDAIKDTFLLSITTQVAYNLDLLLPEVLVFNQCREKYYISFKMFGITLKSKPFCRDLHANIPMNEKIVVRIRSEYNILREYLSDYCQILVCFYCGRDKLGMTKLAVDKLLRNIDDQDFLVTNFAPGCEQKCFFRFPSRHGMVPSGPNKRQPYIEVATTIKRMEQVNSSYAVSRDCSEENFAARSVESVTFPSRDEGKAKKVEEELEEVETESVEVKDLETQEEEEEVNIVEVDEAPIKEEEEETNIEEQLALEIRSPRGSISPGAYIGCGDNEEQENNKFDLVATSQVSASGDQNIEAQERELTEEENIENSTQWEKLTTKTSESTENLLKNTPPLPSPDSTIKPEDILRNITLYQKYCLDVILENISLKKPLKSNILCFKFKHPKASVAMIKSEINIDDNLPGEDILLENTRCKMFFISTNEHIRKMVYAWAPKLIMTDENDQILTEELDVYTAMFLSQQRVECSYMTELKTIRTYEPLAKISISMYLQEYGLTALPKPTNYDLLPVVLDEEIAIKELQDMQEWKEVQHVQFSADLKILEKQRVSKLQKDWAKRKKELEGKLSKSVTRCQNLSQELQAAVNNIRTKQALELKESQMSLLPNGSFQDNLQKNALKYRNYETKELIETISRLERSNDHLNGVINDQRLEIQQIKKTALTKEQTANLLQQLKGLEEKFEDAQKTKAYFKEQWKRAVREIHDLRSEEHKQIQEKIQNQRIELSQLSLDGSTLGDAGNGNNFDYGDNTLASSDSFGDFKWDNLDFPLGMPSNSSYTTHNI